MKWDIHLINNNMADKIILCFMQNMWVKKPKKMYKILKEKPNDWNMWCKTLLFAGCTSGRRLKQAFGDVVNLMIWDETTKEICDNPRTVPKADLTHISDTIKRIKPDIIITFGKHAEKAVCDMYESGVIYYHSTPLPKHFFLCTHPAARQPDTIEKLTRIAQKLNNVLQSNP